MYSFRALHLLTASALAQVGTARAMFIPLLILAVILAGCHGFLWSRERRLMSEDITIGEKTPGAKTFNNPDNVSVKSDTDSPDVPDHLQDAKMNTSLAPLKSNLHPLEQHFQPSKPKRTYGRGIPPEDLKITEN